MDPDEDAVELRPSKFVWSQLRSYTDELDPEEVPELIDVRGIELAWPLLRAVVGQGPEDLVLRMASLRAVMRASQGYITADGLDRALSFLNEDSRTGMISVLQKRGWLVHVPSFGWTITTEGGVILDMIGLLQKRVADVDLFASASAMEVAGRFGLPMQSWLHEMRNKLVRLRIEIEEARGSRSRILLERMKLKIDEALRHSGAVVAGLAYLPIHDEDDIQTREEIHKLLSALHAAATRLEKDISEAGRQYVVLPEGYSIEQVTRGLLGLEPDRLAGAALAALLPAYVPHRQLNTETLAHAAVSHFQRDRFERPSMQWAEPAPSEDIPTDDDSPEVAEFVAELEVRARLGREATFHELVLQDDPADSMLRMSLMALVGEGSDAGGEGPSGRLANLALEIDLSEGGWPQPTGREAPRAMSNGMVKPRRKP